MPGPHTRPEPYLLPIRRPACPMCEGRMMLVAIAPGLDGLELRTFKCRDCSHSFTNAVAADAMEAVSAGAALPTN